MDDWIASQHLPTNLGFNAGCWFSVRRVQQNPPAYELVSICLTAFPE